MNQTTAFSNSGTVRIALYDAAVPFSSRGFFDTGNSDQLDYSVTESVVDLPDSRDPAGGIDRSMRKVQSAGGTLKMRHMSKETLAIALWGKSTDIDDTAVTNEVHKLHVGRFVPADHLIDTTKAVVVKKGATIIAPADYLIEENGGGIIFNATLTTSGVVDKEAITYDYTPLVQYDIDALVQAAPLISIMCVGQNSVDGKPCSDRIYKARVGAIKQLSSIGNGQFGELLIEYTIEKDATIVGADNSKYYKRTSAE